MKSLLTKSLLASLALFTVSATHADAAVIVTLPTVSTAGSIQITNDINFTITQAGDVKFFVFDEWVTSDGSLTGIGASITPSSLSYSLNGGATQTRIITNFRDNLASTIGAVTPNDGYIFMNSGFAVVLNDLVTIKAATYTLAAGSLAPGFNPQTNQTFTGNAFLTDSFANRLSANTSVGAVPEPSRALLLLGGLSTLAFRRRRVA